MLLIIGDPRFKYNAAILSLQKNPTRNFHAWHNSQVVW